MIKLTNAQASAFNSPIVGKLFADPERQFPIDDAFRLADIVQEIQNKLQVYNPQLQKVIEDTGGKIQPNGQVQYPDPESSVRAQEAINKLNAVEIEIPGQKVAIKASWPNLSLAEATILRAITENDSKK